MSKHEALAFLPQTHNIDSILPTHFPKSSDLPMIKRPDFHITNAGTGRSCLACAGATSRKEAGGRSFEDDDAKERIVLRQEIGIITEDSEQSTHSPTIAQTKEAGISSDRFFFNFAFVWCTLGI